MVVVEEPELGERRDLLPAPCCTVAPNNLAGILEWRMCTGRFSFGILSAKKYLRSQKYCNGNQASAHNNTKVSGAHALTSLGVLLVEQDFATLQPKTWKDSMMAKGEPTLSGTRQQDVSMTPFAAAQLILSRFDVQTFAKLPLYR